MTPERSAESQRIFETLQHYGILLASDTRLPSVATLVAGEPVRGSWWAHPRAHDIHAVAHTLGERSDVIVAKLISRKDTYVHRQLWPAIIAVGAAREAWQLAGLSSMAKRLLDIVSKDGELRTADVPWAGGPKRDSPGEAARQLEQKLLVHGEEVHTESGAHAKRLESWQRWADRAEFGAKRMTPEQGKKKLEQVLAVLNEQYQAKGRLSWRPDRRGAG